MGLWNDRERTRGVLTILLDNALRFSDTGSKVGIDVSEQEESVWVSVWDTGVGIPEDEFENIFLPFFQIEDSLIREHEGMGMGLAIAKGMVELCGGRIWVESVVSEGSRFTFTLPK